MVSAVASGDRQHVGASAVEAAQSLRTFVSAVHGVCSTRKDTPMDRSEQSCSMFSSIDSKVYNVLMNYFVLIL